MYYKNLTFSDTNYMSDIYSFVNQEIYNIQIHLQMSDTCKQVLYLIVDACDIDCFYLVFNVFMCNIEKQRQSFGLKCL